MAEQYARLSSDHNTVLCGHTDAKGAQTCTGILGRVETIPSVRQAADPDWPTVEDPVIQLEVPVRVVQFPLGWAVFDGIWQQTKHARDNIKHGRQSDYRRGMLGLTDDQRRNLLESRYRLSPRAYPAQAKCPRCQCVQILDLERLDLTSPDAISDRGLTFGEIFDRPRQ
jgi:hypothetical protein